MKNVRNILIAIVVVLLLPLTVYADCESDFKAVEKEFKVSYNYNKETDDFTIIFVTPDYEKYGFTFKNKEELNNTEIKYNGKEQTLTVKNYKETTYSYAFIAMYNQCLYKTVKSGTIELKKYNPYSDDSLCLGNEDFILCQKDYDKAVDEETFKTRLEAYKQNKENSNYENNIQNEENVKEKETEARIIDNIVEYIQNNLVEVIIICLIILVFLITAIAYIKKSIKSRRLE